MSAATVRIEIPIRDLDNANLKLNQMAGKLDKVEKAVVKASYQVKYAGKSMVNFLRESSEWVSHYDREIEKVQRALIKMVREEYKISLEMADNLSPKLNGIKKGLYEITGRTWSVTVTLADQVTAQIQNILKNTLPQLNNPYYVNAGVQGGTNKNISYSNGKSTSLSERTEKSTRSSFENLSNRFMSSYSKAEEDNSSIMTNVQDQIKVMSSFNSVIKDFKIGGAENITGMANAGMVAVGIDALESAYKDFKIARESDDATKTVVYDAAAASTVLATATGAAIGTAILPGVGTIIGAGIGKLVGDWFGNSIKDDYEQIERDASIREAQAKYETDEMRDAIQDLADGIITAEQASKIFAQEVEKGVKSRFGEAKFSLQEIADMAQQLVFGDHVKEFERFSASILETEKSMASMQEAYSGFEKASWKIGLNLELEEGGIEGLRTSAGAAIQGAVNYLLDKYDEVNHAADLLFVNPWFLESAGVDSTFTGLITEAQTKGQELQGAIDRYANGETTDTSEIMEAYQELYAVTDKVSQANKEAQKEVRQMKYGKSDMDYESSMEYLGAIKEYKTQSEQGYEQAAQSAILATILNEDLTEPRKEELIGATKEYYHDRNRHVDNEVDKEMYDMISKTYPEFEKSEIDAKKFKDGIDEMVNANGFNVKDLLAGNYDLSEYFKDLPTLGDETKAGLTPFLAAYINTFLEDSIRDLQNNGIGEESSSQQGEDPTVTTSSGGSMSDTPAAEAGEYDYYAADTIVPGIADGIANTDMGSINDAINTLKENVQAAIDSAFSAGFETSTSVRINANYSLTGGLSVPGSITTNPALQYRPHANGDIVNGPQFSLIGEDGPEAIIPLGSKRRDRGLNLWQQAGELLGVGRYADGGILSGDSGGVKTYLPSGDSGSSLPDQGDGSGINVSVNMSPTFEINNDQTSGENGVVSTLKSHIRDMTDEVADELAVRLQKIFGNMPTKEA